MLDSRYAFNILSKTKSLYKEHCKMQCFCEKCEYKTSTSYNLDCFEKFYVKNFDSILNQLKKRP